jgi:hypothetical protein
MTPRSLLTSLLLLAITSVNVLAADAPWRIGLASADITPDTPIPMAGYGARVRPFTRVEQPIHAKALLLEDSRAHRALLITTDLVGLSADLADPVCQRIIDTTHLTRDQILLSCSHNHSGPLTALAIRPSVGISPDDARNVLAYTKRLQDQLVDLATRATSATLQPATLSYATGIVNFPVNRRQFTPNGIILGVNPRGPVDRTVPVLRVESPDDHKPLAVVFGCACHNTSLTGGNYLLCGDYAGFAQSEIEQQLPGVQAMFMIGCGGDANPYPRDHLEDAKAHGHELATEVLRVFSKVKPTPLPSPLTTTFARVDLPLRSVTRDELESIVQTKKPAALVPSATRMLEMLDHHEPLPTAHAAPIGVWQFGKELTLVALSGEAVVDYALLLEKSIGPLNLWPAGYCNDVFGYLPSRRMLDEGGYETRGLRDGAGFFAPEVQDAVISKVRDLAHDAGRQMP